MNSVVAIKLVSLLDIYVFKNKILHDLFVVQFPLLPAVYNKITQSIGEFCVALNF